MMKSIVALFAAAAVAALAAPAQAADKSPGEALAQQSGCLACHTIDKKLVGPSYKEIADRYRKDKGAEANLFKKVKEGGKGTWGDIPMTPNAHVKDQDIKTIVQWILSIK
jgi:cytochrome c